MISVNLRDEHASENARAILELQKLGMFSDAEIQEMYNEQVKRDNERDRVSG